MKWLPAGLPAWVSDLARALDKQFAPRFPDQPPRLKAFAATDLTAALAERNPYGVAIDSTNNRLVISVLVAGVWTWRRWDGTAL